MENGKLIIFAAPSGSGKTTIVRELLKRMPELMFSVSACTRPKRDTETHGKDYYFLTVEDFQQKIANEEFVEWQMVYEGKYYGTLRTEVERIWASGKHVIFDMDVEGGVELKRLFGDRAISVFIKAPNLEELERRLIGRGSETEETLKIRMDKAISEMEYASKFDVILENDDLNNAMDLAEATVRKLITQ